MGNTNTTKVTLGNYVQNYTKTGQTVLNNCQNVLRNANVPIPIVNTENQGEKNLTGLVLEHADEPEQTTSSATGGTVVSEEPAASSTASEPVVAEGPTEAPKTDEPAESQEVVSNDEEDQAVDESKKSKDNKNKKDNTETATTKSSFSDSNSTANGVYSSFAGKEAKLSSKDNISGAEQNGLNVAGNLVDAMEDIEAAGQSHIDALTEELPDDGLITGSASGSYKKSTYEDSISSEVNIQNTWQNKNKTFGIVAKASFGYERTTTKEQIFEISDEEYNMINDDSDDENDVEEKAQAASRATRRADAAEGGQENVHEYILEPSTNVNKTGSFAVNARYKKGDFIYGAGLSSTFSADNNQVHDQFITVKNVSTNIAGDLMRRTHVSYDSVTGERYSKAKMKLKLDLLNRGKDEDFFDDESVQEEEQTQPQQPVSDNAENTDAQNTDAENADGTENEEERLSDVIKNDTITKAQEDAKKHKVKDGSGWDIDFKYDDSVCGLGAEYGINIINDTKEKTRFTVAPLAGIYDYTPAAEDEDEALQGTVGVATEFKKKWKDGQSVDLSLTAVANRVVSKGYEPKDLTYVVFSGSYKNSRKKLNADLDAGIINNGVTVAYVEAGVSKQFKNLNLKAQGGYFVNKSDYSKESGYQFLLTGTFNIPYGNKKK